MSMFGLNCSCEVQCCKDDGSHTVLPSDSIDYRGNGEQPRAVAPTPLLKLSDIPEARDLDPPRDVISMPAAVLEAGKPMAPVSDPIVLQIPVVGTAVQASRSGSPLVSPRDSGEPSLAKHLSAFEGVWLLKEVRGDKSGVMSRRGMGWMEAKRRSLEGWGVGRSKVRVSIFDGHTFVTVFLDGTPVDADGNMAFNVNGGQQDLQVYDGMHVIIPRWDPNLGLVAHCQYKEKAFTLRRYMEGSSMVVSLKLPEGSYDHVYHKCD